MSIYDTSGEKEYRVVSFGMKKAKAIDACIDHVREFIDENKSNIALNLDKLTEEEKALVQSFIVRK
jgi:hypothetical protein